MLKFIYGLPSSGKTTTVLQLIKESISDDKKVVLLVPEQFSFQSERAMLKLLGDDNASKVNVTSFTRLYAELSDEIGGNNARILNDGDKIIMMNRTLNALKDELTVWGKYANSLNFSKSLLDTIGEFKVNAISAADLRNAAYSAQKTSLKNKLNDLALIYENFDALLGEKFIDPIDKLTKVYRQLEATHYFKGKTVFFDSFKAFTGQQFKIIDRIINQADNVYFAINNDVSSTKDYDLFHNIRKNISKIIELAKKNNVVIDEPIILEGSKYTNSNLCNLERLMANNPVTSDLEDSVTVCKCNTPFDEAEFAARNIRRLVREKGYRYKDFVIIARDTERYQQAIEYATAKNDIVCFYDKRISLNSLPFSFVVDAAISALDLSTENILRFHKCGFSKLSTDDISELENYTFLWNINGDLWLKEWDMDPRGFDIKEMTDEEFKKLKKINEIKTKALEPIINFKNNFYGTAKQRATAIVELLESANAKKVLKTLCERYEELENEITPDILKQGYAQYMAVLDSLVISFGNKTLSKNEFYEALNMALSVETVAAVPQFLDEVTFGSADRIQPARPKIAFILGCNQGVFPKISSASGVLTQSERKEIIDLDIEISDNSIEAAIDENYLVYANICCADEKIFITYSTSNSKGEELLVSPFVTAICDNLNPKLLEEPNDELSIENLPETNEAVFSKLCQSTGNKKSVEILSNALENTEHYNAVISAVNKDLNTITPENAEKLFGNSIYLSASKVDTINRCRFSYFCKYGLRTESLKAAEFNNLQRGNIAHFVLEKFISENKDNLNELTEQDIESLTDKYIEEYLNCVTGFNQIRDARFDFIIYRLARSLKDVAKHITAELKQSDFKPVACELKIGMDSPLQLEFPYDKGIIKISGSIDRVDQYGDYIRVVDYKTGSKSFKLPDIIYGLNMQMLIYLYALIRGQNRPDTDAAAILYKPAQRDVKNEGLIMNGLIISEPQIVQAMEKDNLGEFIPKVTYTKENKISKKNPQYIETENFSYIFDHIENIMRKTGNLISQGDISISPVDGKESPACKYCEYKSICNIDETGITKIPRLGADKVFKIIKGEEEIDNGI